MKIYIHLKGDDTRKSTYLFSNTNFNQLISPDNILFGISYQLISIPTLKNTLENLNYRQIVVEITNDNIIRMINNPDFKQAGIDLLRNEFIKKYRIK